MEWEYPLEWQIAIDKAVEALSRERQGIWEKLKWSDLSQCYIYKCSVCGRVADEYDAKSSHWCPDCGSAMVMVVENE